MNLERVTNLRAPDGHSIPALSVSPDSPRSGAVLLHPYGCSKEHMLGLALALAEKGVASVAIDLCGHGENMSAIGPGMLGEVEAAVSYARSGFGRVGCTGLSIGGRFSLMSSADYVAAMSPAVVTRKASGCLKTFPGPACANPIPATSLNC